MFLELSGAMVRDLEKYGVVTFPRLKSVDEELWQWLKDRNTFMGMGRRTSMARYGAALNSAMKWREYWTVALWERT